MGCEYNVSTLRGLSMGGGGQGQGAGDTAPPPPIRADILSLFKNLRFWQNLESDQHGELIRFALYKTRSNDQS